ncbi:MAG: afsK 4 [Gemmataceae bacterium]|nr:afsK 4 [Gemmataceae bacterium]
MYCPAFRPRRAAPAFLSLALLLLTALPAPAVILKLIPLKDVLEGEQIIFVATVDTVTPDKPAVVFKFEEKLKGDAPFERLPVNLTGDAEAKKDGHTKVMLDRLEPGRKLVIFATKIDKKYDAKAFMEGTWFSLQGTIDEDGKTVRWAFLHAEPYLRRTFAGTTAELKKVVADGLAKKAEPPPVNEKEKPGFGPPVEKKCGAGNAEPVERGPRNAERVPDDRPSYPGFHSAVRAPRSALLGVIPSFVLVGPLAIIAALFPGVAARMAIGMKRWRAFLVIASTNSTMALVYWLLRDFQVLPDWWMFGYRGFTLLLLVSTAVGVTWAGRRYRRMACEEPRVTSPPARSELLTLAGLTGLVGLTVASTRLFGPWSAAVDLPMREFTLIGISLLAATLYTAYRATGGADRLPDDSGPAVQLSLSGESVGLGALFLGGLVAVFIGGDAETRAGFVGTQAGDAEEVFGPKLTDVRVFEVSEAHQVMSGIAVDGDRLYFGASRATGFRANGFVFCLDRNTGRSLWKFDSDGKLKQVFCTPTPAGGKVYFGEGLHTDSGCQLFCVDAATGKPAWPNPFETASHTEGTPRVAHGRVYFTAGDDGLFCADAVTGEKKWQLAGTPNNLHIDTPPMVSGDRLFAGSGYGTYALLGVDAHSGKELWRTPVSLRSFGPPLVIGDRVAYGLGTGNLSQDIEGDEKAPAGAVVCVNADDGKEVWKYELTRSVHTPLAADVFSVYATSRDGAVHCLDRKTGKPRWKTGIGATITAGPAVATAGGMPVAVYAISTEGMTVCLNPQTGKVVWSRDLREHTKRMVKEVYTTPAVVTEPTSTGSRRVIYTGALVENHNNGAKTAAVFRFEDELGE